MSTNPATIIDDPNPGDPPANDPPAPPANDPPANDPPAADPPAADPAKAAADAAALAAEAAKNGDWRTQLAGDDADVLKFLGRYQSQANAMKGFKKLNDDLKGGKFIKPLGEDATDEEKAAYRTALGVPDKAEAYLEKLPDGLVIGDDDRPMVDKFATAMLAANAPKAGFDAALASYYEILDEQVEAETTANNGARQVTEDTLREEWGGDYRRNVNVLKGYIGAMPEGLGDLLAGARDAGGVQVLNNPAMVKWLMDQALRDNPLATVVPGAGANQSSAIADEIAGIEKMMRDDRKSYNKDERVQARYRELLEAREKLGGN